MNKLLASSLSKTYYSAGHKLEVLKNVNITLAQGKTIGVIGSSGSGKTTLLQILAGLEFSDKGDIFYNDIDLLANGAKKFNSMRSFALN